MRMQNLDWRAGLTRPAKTLEGAPSKLCVQSRNMVYKTSRD